MRDVYTITAQTSENGNLIYRNVIDDECGFMPAAETPDKIQRGTRAYQSDWSENAYVLKTVCYKILYAVGGASPVGDYYIPCRPEDAKLKYKLITIPSE